MKRRTLFFQIVIVAILFSLVTGCSRGGNTITPPPAITIPTLATSAVTDITTLTAKGGGSITKDGGATITAKGICWGTSHNPTTANSYATDSSNSNVTISVSMSNLSPNTTYYVRAYATNSVGTAYGDEQSFKTSVLLSEWKNIVDDNRFSHLTSFFIKDKIIVASTLENGISTSNDGGKTWTASSGVPKPIQVHDFIESGTNLLAAADVNSILKSSDNGNSWTKVTAGLPNNYVRAFSFARKGTDILVTTGSGIYKSTDNGDSWTLLSHINTATCILVQGDNILLGGETSTGVTISTDNGKTWTLTDNGIYSYTTITSLDTVGTTIYAGTNGSGAYSGAYMSTDGAKTWKAIKGIPQNIQVSCFVGKGSTVYAATSDGAYISNDNGSSWTLDNTGFTQEGTRISKFLISGDNIYAALYYKGLFYRPI